MAIDKRTFKAGMNKDVDFRLLPEDHYVDGVNIRNDRASDGAITPILGNKDVSGEFKLFEQLVGEGGKAMLHLKLADANFSDGANPPFQWEFEIQVVLRPMGSTSSADNISGPRVFFEILETEVNDVLNNYLWNPSSPSYSNAGLSMRQAFAYMIYYLAFRSLHTANVPGYFHESHWEDNPNRDYIMGNLEIPSLTGGELTVNEWQVQHGDKITLLAGTGLNFPLNFCFDVFTFPAMETSSPQFYAYNQYLIPDPADKDGYDFVQSTEIAETDPIARCVGAVKDDITRKIYYFIHQIQGNADNEEHPRDWILEYDITAYDSGAEPISIVYSELQNYSAGVLNFALNGEWGTQRKQEYLVHSIDIINSKFLTWTDNLNTPKRINIDKCKKGYAFYVEHQKRFTDNHMALVSETTEFGGVTYGDTDIDQHLTFVGEQNFNLDPGDIIFVEQDEGFCFHEYNGYHKILYISADGKKLVTDKKFISSSPTHGGKLWKIVAYNDNNNTYSFYTDPSELWFPEAYSNIYKHIKEQYLNAHKRGPRDRATYEYYDDSTKKKNDLWGHVWQFAYRYIYDDDDVSAMSPISTVKIPSHMASNSGAGQNYAQEHHNKIKVTIPRPNDGIDSLQTNYGLGSDPDITSNQIGNEGWIYSNNNNPNPSNPKQGICKRLYAWPSNIKSIEIYARQNNKAPMTLIDTLRAYSNICDPEYTEIVTQEAADDIAHSSSVGESNFVLWEDLVVPFWNDGIYPLLDVRSADKLYDWLPHKAQTQTVIDNSSILYANVTDGFDLVCDMNAGVSATYKSTDDPDDTIQAGTIQINPGPQFYTYLNNALALNPQASPGHWWTSSGPAEDQPDLQDDLVDSFGSGSMNALEEPGENYSAFQSNIGVNAEGFSTGAQQSLASPGPGLGNNHAFIHWAGSNDGGLYNGLANGWRRIRYVLQIDFSGCPVDTDGNVIVGTTFNCSGAIRFAYLWGADKRENRFGIAYEFENISVTCNSASTSLSAFGESCAAAFRALPNMPPIYDVNQFGVGNWKTTEVLNGGTFFDLNGNSQKSPKQLYVYFRSTTDSDHVVGINTDASLRTFALHWEGSFTELSDGISAFKSGAFHDFGIIYGNDRNQVSFVNKDSNTRTYVKFPPERLSGDSYAADQTNTLGLPMLKWEIHHSPPRWAEWYQWVYAGNTSVKDFLQFTAERVALNYDEPGDKKIYLSLNSFKGSEYSYKKQDNPVIDYVFGEGDRIRFIANKDGAISTYIDVPIQEARYYNYMTEETDIDPALSNPTREFYEAKFGSNEDAKKKYMEGYWISFKAPDVDGFKYENISTSNDAGYEKLLFEIYNPAKQADEGPVAFYGFSKKLPIGRQLTNMGSTRYHCSDNSATGVDQNGTTPASGIFKRGDIYINARRMVDWRSGATTVSKASYMIESYFANDFIQSDSYNKGRKHVYTPFAKEEKRHTTVYYSGPYLPSSNVNGLSEFNPIDIPLKEYSIGYGDIERVLSRDSNLLIFQRNKVSRVMVNKQVLLGATGSSNVALSDQILSEATPYAGDYGPAYAASSVVAKENKVYFVDPIRGCMLRLSGDGITVISNNGFRNYFADFFNERQALCGRSQVDYPNASQNRELPFYKHVAGIDPETNEYIYYFKSQPKSAKDQFDLSYRMQEKTIGFYEEFNKYVSFYSYEPEMILHQGQRLFTWKNGIIYQHNIDLECNKFYNNIYKSELDFVWNGQPSMVKLYNVISLEGNHPWTFVKLQTESFTTQTYLGMQNPVDHFPWVLKEGIFYKNIQPGTKYVSGENSQNTSLYYEEQIQSSIEGVGEVTIISVSETSESITIQWDDDFSKYIQVVDYEDQYPLFVFTDENNFLPAKAIAIQPGMNGTATLQLQYLSSSFIVAIGQLITDYMQTGLTPANNKMYLAKRLSLAANVEGERARGTYARVLLELEPEDFNFVKPVRLYAMNIDMEYSPLSYKNN